MKMGRDAVSEIIGAIFLLAMAIVVFSVIYLNVLADDGPDPNAFLTVIGNIDENFNITFDHSLGEEIPVDSPIDITVGGHPLKDFVDFSCENVSDLISTNIIDINKWNIGEQLLCPLNEKFAGYEIKANIYDIESNSMVFWGTLQEGKMFEGFGGIWHFNESSWESGKPNEVTDISGNGNHGTAYNAITVDDNVSGLTNRSGYFDYFDYNGNDFVVVPDDLSLDITNQITIETWIQPKNLDNNTLGFLENEFGYTPYIINHKNDVYIVVSEDKSHNGMIQTFSISPHGVVSHTPINGSYFYNSKGPKEQPNLMPIISHIYGDIYVVAFMDEANHISLKTFNISSDGEKIDYTGNSLTFNDSLQTSVRNRPGIIKVSEGIFAFAYRISTSTNTLTGIIRTVNISNIGSFSDYEYNSHFDDNGAYEPSIINVAGDVFAVAYRNQNNHGIIKRLKISYNDIEYTGINLTFEKSNCYTPNLIKLYTHNYVVVYSDKGGQPKGYYITIEMADDGTITNLSSKKIFENLACSDPIAIKISDRIFAVVYEGPVHHLGRLITVHPEFSSDLFTSGIYKYGSYGIFVNSTIVLGYINDITLDTPKPNSSSWHHVALTYDRNQMKLYVDGVLKNSIDMTEKIKITQSNLIFGNFYYGYLDEIAIFNRALPLINNTNPTDAISYHYTNPGIFEN